MNFVAESGQFISYELRRWHTHLGIIYSRKKTRGKIQAGLPRNGEGGGGGWDLPDPRCRGTVVTFCWGTCMNLRKVFP